ncbi:hypothetical protein ACFL4G_10890 [Thermodesulfobacteriota bacterium]
MDIKTLAKRIKENFGFAGWFSEGNLFLRLVSFPALLVAMILFIVPYYFFVALKALGFGRLSKAIRQTRTRIYFRRERVCLGIILFVSILVTVVLYSFTQVLGGGAIDFFVNSIQGAKVFFIPATIVESLDGLWKGDWDIGSDPVLDVIFIVIGFALRIILSIIIIILAVATFFISLILGLVCYAFVFLFGILPSLSPFFAVAWYGAILTAISYLYLVPLAVVAGENALGFTVGDYLYEKKREGFIRSRRKKRDRDKEERGTSISEGAEIMTDDDIKKTNGGEERLSRIEDAMQEDFESELLTLFSLKDETAIVSHITSIAARMRTRAQIRMMEAMFEKYSWNKKYLQLLRETYEEKINLKRKKREFGRLPGDLEREDAEKEEEHKTKMAMYGLAQKKIQHEVSKLEMKEVDGGKDPELAKYEEDLRRRREKEKIKDDHAQERRIDKLEAKLESNKRVRMQREEEMKKIYKEFGIEKPEDVLDLTIEVQEQFKQMVEDLNDMIWQEFDRE